MEVPTPPPSEPHQYIQWGAAIIISTLSMALAALFKMREGENAKRITQLTEAVSKCEGEHQKANERLLVLTEEVGTLRGQIKGIQDKLS
jgi:hypothetical protein